MEFDWDPSGHQLRMKVERNNSKDAIAFIEASVNGLPCLTLCGQGISILIFEKLKFLMKVHNRNIHDE